MRRRVISAFALVCAACAAQAENFVVQPDFLPANHQYYQSECDAPFTGWVDPLRVHLVVVSKAASRDRAPEAMERPKACVDRTALWMKLSGLTENPVLFELRNTRGEVWMRQTLGFN